MTELDGQNFEVTWVNPPCLEEALNTLIDENKRLRRAICFSIINSSLALIIAVFVLIYTW
jgi:hypothetical protein